MFRATATVMVLPVRLVVELKEIRRAWGRSMTRPFATSEAVV